MKNRGIENYGEASARQANFENRKRRRAEPRRKHHRLRKLKQAVREGVVDYECPECGATIRAEPDARRVWCPVCEKSVKVKTVI